MTLSDLRAELGCFLGLDRISDKYVFLKCVGRSLALVSSVRSELLVIIISKLALGWSRDAGRIVSRLRKAWCICFLTQRSHPSPFLIRLQVKFRQEGELTVKSFAPPFVSACDSLYWTISQQWIFYRLICSSYQAPFPELYLLPVGEHDSGLCSSSLTPDTLVSSADHHSQDLLRPTCAPGQSKEPIKFPSINKRAQQSVLMTAEEKNGSDEDTQSTDTRHLTYSSHDQKDPEAKQSGKKSSKHKRMD